MRFSSLVIYLLVCALFIGMPALIYGQPTGGGPGGDPDPVPIAGLEILLMAGAALGIKSLVKSKKSDN